MYKYRGCSPTCKNKYNQIDFFRRRIPEIKLRRTDTTLDLSQKAKRAGEKREKGKEREGGKRGFKYSRALDSADGADAF